MEFVNLTPHPIAVVPDNGAAIGFPVAGRAVRTQVTTHDLGYTTINGQHVPLVTTTLGPVHNLPAPAAGVRYIVSGKVAAACGRTDLVVPHGLIIDQGRVIGCRALAVR